MLVAPSANGLRLIVPIAEKVKLTRGYRRVRINRSSLFGLETSVRTQLDKDLALCRRGSNRVADRCRRIEMGKPRCRAGWHQAFLILYSLYALFRPVLKLASTDGKTADAAVGFFNGILAGATGLAGILVTIWCGRRGWPKDQQGGCEQ